MEFLQVQMSSRESGILSDSKLFSSSRNPYIELLSEEPGLKYEERIDLLFGLTCRTLLTTQNAVTGLFPTYSVGSVEASIRENVYCAATLWAMSVALQNIDDIHGRTYYMRQSAVKCMRAIIDAFMNFSSSIGKFTVTPVPEAAVPATIDINTCSGRPHLEMDLVATFVFFLCKMIDGGVKLIFTRYEVDLVQNLIYYLERSYRIPDYGIWGIGSRMLNRRELHASSLGITKAALQAANNCNLFGLKDVSYVVHVDTDAVIRDKDILERILPRESSSKDVDASLLLITGFPFFSVEWSAVSKNIFKNVTTILEGQYGIRRFRCDKLDYISKKSEANSDNRMDFVTHEGVEPQWPMFLIINAITAILTDDIETFKKYHRRISKLIFYGDNDLPMVPQCFYIDEHQFEEEKLKPYSQKWKMFPELGFHCWTQSLFIFYLILKSKVIDPAQLGFNMSHMKIEASLSLCPDIFYGSDNVVQISLISETTCLQKELATYGLVTQNIDEIEPIALVSPSSLATLFSMIGCNKTIGLGGRPLRPLGVLCTSKIYRFHGRLVACYPLGLDMNDYYLTLDIKMLIDNLKAKMRFLSTAWQLNKRPTFIIFLRPVYFRGTSFAPMLSFLKKMITYGLRGIRTRVDRLNNLIPTSCVENININLKEDVINSVCFKCGSSDEIKDLEKEVEYEFPGRASLSSTCAPLFASVSLCSGMNSDSDTFDFNDMFLTENGLSQLKVIYPSIDDLIGAYFSETLFYKKVFLLRYATYMYSYDTPFNSTNDDCRRNGERTIFSELNRSYKKACVAFDWLLARYTSSLMRKFADSLAPSITLMLVSGVQISIGIYGHDEYIITDPISPHAIFDLINVYVARDSPAEASLQQEVILHMTQIFVSQPELMKFIFTIRLGNVTEAMRRVYILKEGDLMVNPSSSNVQKSNGIYSLSPLEIKELLLHTLKVPTERELGCSSLNDDPYEMRVINGLLGVSPPEFFKVSYVVLCATTEGIIICGKRFPRTPNVVLFKQKDWLFGTGLIDILNSVSPPEMRQLYIESMFAVSVIVKRNPEVKLGDWFDLGELIENSKHSAKVRNSESQEDDYSPISRLAYLSHEEIEGVFIRTLVSSILDSENFPEPSSCRSM